MQFKPNDRPLESKDKLFDILKSKGLDPSKSVCILGVRGYSSGQGHNERAVYDDAIFIVGPNVCRAFSANTDPGAFRDGIASLESGVWLYKVGIHGLNKPKEKQYMALVQANVVVVQRDGGARETGFFGINIHRGGFAKVNSEGCQTVHPDQWDDFFLTIQEQLKTLKQSTVQYCLIDVE